VKHVTIKEQRIRGVMNAIAGMLRLIIEKHFMINVLNAIEKAGKALLAVWTAININPLLITGKLQFNLPS